MASPKARCGRPLRPGTFVRLVGGERGLVVAVEPDLAWVRVDHTTDERLPNHPDVAMERMPADPSLLRVVGCSACK